MKLAIVDLDMVVADNTGRMKKAKSRRDWYEANLREALAPELTNPINAQYIQKSLNDLLETLYWQRAFTPELVQQDTLIEGAKEALEHLHFAYGYETFFLTSRPEDLRRVTEEWLFAHNILFYQPSGQTALIMKPAAFHFTRTVTWKAGMVCDRAVACGATELLFIDDQQEIITEIEKYRNTLPKLTTAKSLAEAVAKVKEQE